MWPVIANAQSSAALVAGAMTPATPVGRPAGRPDPAGSATGGSPVRADVPGALDHASGDVDEFDAALVRGAGGVPADDRQTLLPRPSISPSTKSRTRLRPRAISARRSETPGRWRDGVVPVAVGWRSAASPRPSRPRALPSAAATARSAFSAPAGPSCNGYSGPTAARSSRRPPSSWASSRSPAPISAWRTTSPRKSSNSSSVRNLN